MAIQFTEYSKKTKGSNSSKFKLPIKKSLQFNTTSSEWLDFLLQQGAIFNFDKSKVLSFGATEAQLELEKNFVKFGQVVCDLSHLSLIAVTGDDAIEFLDKQLTTNLNLVENMQVQETAYLLPNGYVFANFYFLRRNDNFYLLVSSDIKKDLLNRLNMFVLRSNVEFIDLSAEMVAFGFAGKFAEIEIQRCLNITPSNLYQIYVQSSPSVNSDVFIFKIPAPYPSFILFSSVIQAKQNWKILEKQNSKVGFLAWDVLDILMGRAQLKKETSQKFLSHHLNFDILNKVDFKKGCYPGQEIVSKTHFRAKASHRLFRFIVKQNLLLNDSFITSFKDSLKDDDKHPPLLKEGMNIDVELLQKKQKDELENTSKNKFRTTLKIVNLASDFRNFTNILAIVNRQQFKKILLYLGNSSIKFITLDKQIVFYYEPHPYELDLN